MRIKQLFVLIQIRNKGVRGWYHKSSLGHPVFFFTLRSQTVLLLWVLFVIYVSCLSCCLVCSLQQVVVHVVACWEGTGFFALLCPGSGVVLDCIDS